MLPWQAGRASKPNSRQDRGHATLDIGFPTFPQPSHSSFHLKTIHEQATSLCHPQPAQTHRQRCFHRV
jgi:hypothetical protein